MESVEKIEEQTLKFWQKNRIYEKSREKNVKGAKFYFMDGPPYATGHIHMGTALNKILKDIALRSRRLQGFDVFDRPGYDTHGVPIELQVEKEIKSRGKQDIEKFGIKNFVGKCKKFATKYIEVMNDEFKNLGVWMDWENPYLTLSDEYIEAIWSAFKQADKKDLLYLGKYPVHVCPRCETAVAFNEIEYAKQKDTSIFVKFPLEDKKGAFLLIWTTTPWTLPGNTGVMVNPEVYYQEIETADGEIWIIAKELVPRLMEKFGERYTVKKEYKGGQMEGWKYVNPLAKDLKLEVKKGYKVILSSRYVNLEEGTGLVHSAPGHGKEDYEVGKKYGIDMPSLVSIDGTLTEEAGKYCGKKAREVNGEIVEDLDDGGFLAYKLDYVHDYPLCWRDKTPLLMISQPQWFLKISKIRDKLLRHNDKTNWIPPYMKLRMKAWLEGIGDWPVSRQRYWGTPLPIWHNEETGDKIVVGSIDELKKLSGVEKIGLHKPEIDDVSIKKNGKIYKRIPEVLDVWFDSGVSSWAVLGYPRDKNTFKKFWPADLNIEGKDQFRGWWNSQLILSEIMFDKKPFDNIIVHGMVLDIGKKKMSKSFGNVISPQDMINKYGRDYLRYYFAKLSKGDDFSFDEREFKDIRKVFTILNNVNSFVNQLERKKTELKVEDRWILSRFNSLIKNVERDYNKYDFPNVVQELEGFVFDLSRKYIQLIRDRSGEVFGVLNEIRIDLIKLFAPIIPFTSERIWQELRNGGVVSEESVHLSRFPELNGKLIDGKLEKEFGVVFDIIEKGLAERDKAGIGLKWPLAKAVVKTDRKINGELQEIIKAQLNVKKVEVKVDEVKVVSVRLDTKMTRELESEGYAREISRKVQAARKKAGLVKTDLIRLGVVMDKELRGLVGNQVDFIKERVNAESIVLNEEGEKYKYESEDKIKGKIIRIFFSKI